MKDVLIYGYNDNSLEVVTILSSFSRVMVVFSTMEPKTFQFQVLDPDIRVRYIKQVINPIRRGEGLLP